MQAKIDTKHLYLSFKFFLVFGAAGLFFLIVMVSTMIIAPMADSTKQNAEVTASSLRYTEYRSEGSLMYTPIFGFSVDGRAYECSAGYSSNLRNASANSQIHYDPDDPQNCRVGDTPLPLFVYSFMIIPLVFIAMPVVSYAQTKKKVEKIRHLEQVGTLIKNLPYEMVDSNVRVNDRKLRCISVRYTLPNGVETDLMGNARWDGKESDADGFVDLLIDFSDPSNYYLDFNIDGAGGSYTPPKNHTESYSPPPINPENSRVGTMPPPIA